MLSRYLRLFSFNLLFITVTAASAFTFFYCTSNADAQDETGNGDNFQFDSYMRYIPARSVKAMSGEVEIIESDADCSYELKAFDKLPVKFSLNEQHIGIENTTDVELPAHLVGLATDIETTLPFFSFEDTYLRLGVSPSFYSDDWDCASSNFRIPSRYFLIFIPNDKWTFIGGIGVYPDFETAVFPILGFIYKPNDKLSFNITPKRPNISYLLNKRVRLFAEGGMSFDEFEVTKDSQENVVLSYKKKYLGSGVEFKFNKFIKSSVTVGGVFNRSLKYRDSLGKVNMKSSLYTEFRVQISI